MTSSPEQGGDGQHMAQTRARIARTLAALKGFAFGGEFDPSLRYDAKLYFVPHDTLVGIERARRIGIRSQQDLFGGVVPSACAMHKTIVHPLVSPQARAPRGWSRAFAARVREVVLPGVAAFSLEDARRAGAAMLRRGAVRVKPGQGRGGRGQAVVERRADLEAALAGLEEADVQRYGVVVERNLSDVTTYSVGQVCVAELLATYCGTQSLTTDNAGEPVYGGSDLLVARGGFDALEALPLAPEALAAVRQARAFDAATAELRGFFASRRNYDIVRGLDGEGRWRCGVLEQSWRVGGASGAEVEALAAFRADPSLSVVRARSTEAYGEAEAPPADAIVHFSGVDPLLGALTKYTQVEAREAPR